MEFIELGHGGPRVSRVGFGCAAIGGHDYGAVDDMVSAKAVIAAIESGVTFFDAADVYGFGHAEDVLGSTLRASGSRDVVIATKVGVRWDDAGRTTRDLSPAWIRRAVDGSLRRLGVDCIDVYQLHWPDPSTSIEDTMGAMLTLRDQGKIRHIGCCNFDEALIERAMRIGTVVSNQLPYSIADRSRESTIRQNASKAEVPLIAYNVLAHGLLSGKYDARATFQGTDLRRRNPLFQPEVLSRALPIVDTIRSVAERCGRTPAQVAIRWVLQRAGVAVALAGAKRAEQARENAGGGNWTLPLEECDVLSDAVARSIHQTATE
jgi:aryl-alcohol dehydrogenase-like predicted oxidoreductase